MAIDSGASLDRLARDRLEPKEINNLLAQGQYKELAALLFQFQIACEQQEDGILADILAVAGQICSACSQSQAEVAWHEHATEEAHQREQEFKQELSEILGSISRKVVREIEKKEFAVPTVSPTEIGLPEPILVKWPDPFYRIWNWLRGNGVHRLSGQLKSFSSGALSVSSLKPEERERGSHSLTVYCLGSFRVYLDDQLIQNWPSSKGRSIFKYMITYRERPVPKEVLMELFWPDAPPDSARNNLNVAIYGLRQAFHEIQPNFSYVLFQDDCYLLNPGLEVWVDVDAFKEHFSTAQNLEHHRDLASAMREYRAAEALYQGEFLAEDRYEDWPMPLRQSLQADYLNLLGRLSRCYLDQEEYNTCATICDKMLVVDPCQEEAHRRLMRCYIRRGQRYLALRQYQLCVETLQQELDVPPASATSTLFEKIRQGIQI